MTSHTEDTPDASSEIPSKRWMHFTSVFSLKGLWWSLKWYRTLSTFKEVIGLEMQPSKEVIPELGHSQGDSRSYTEAEVTFNDKTQKNINILCLYAVLPYATY